MHERGMAAMSGAHGIETSSFNSSENRTLPFGSFWSKGQWMGNENPWDGCRNMSQSVPLLVTGLACCQPQGHTLILVEAYRQSLRIHEIEESVLAAEERLTVNIDRELLK